MKKAYSDKQISFFLNNFDDIIIWLFMFSYISTFHMNRKMQTQYYLLLFARLNLHP